MMSAGQAFHHRAGDLPVKTGRPATKASQVLGAAASKREA